MKVYEWQEAPVCVVSCTGPPRLTEASFREQAPREPVGCWGKPVHLQAMESPKQESKKEPLTPLGSLLFTKPRELICIKQWPS